MSGSDVFTPSLAGRVLSPAGSALVLAEWTAQPQAGPEPMFEAPLHRHDEDEAWYVLSGVLRVRVGDDEVEVPAGGAAIVPRGTSHTYWNPGAEPARYVLILGERTYALIQAIHAATDRSPEAMRELFRSHGAELLA